MEDFISLQKKSEKTKIYLFKNSLTCPVSVRARSILENFIAKHPFVPVFMINVQDSRDISNYVEEVTSIKHESPQILVFKMGKVVFHDSHYGITEEVLEAQLD